MRTLLCIALLFLCSYPSVFAQGGISFWTVTGNDLRSQRGRELFLGTRAKQDLIIKTDSIERMRILASDSITMESDLFIRADLTIDDNFNLTGDATIDNDLEVKGITELRKTLRVGENSIFRRNVSIDGFAETDTLKVDRLISPTDQLVADGSLRIRDSIRIEDNAKIDGLLAVDGNSAFRQNVSIDGFAETDTLKVDRLISPTDQLVADGSLRIRDSIRIEDNAKIDGLLAVDGNSAFRQNVSIDGFAETDTLKVDRLISPTDRLVADGSLRIRDSIRIEDNAKIDGLLAVDGNSAFRRNVSIDGFAETDTLKVDRLISPTDRLVADGSLRIRDSIRIEDNAKIDGLLAVDGNSAFRQNVSIDGFAETDTLKVDRLISPTDQLVADGSLRIRDSIRIEDNAKIDGLLAVDGNSAFRQNVSIDGHTTSDTLFVDRLTGLADTLVASGSLTVEDSILVRKNAVIGGILAVTGDANLNELIVTGETTMSNPLTVNSSATLSSLTVNNNTTMSGTLSTDKKIMAGDSLVVEMDLIANGPTHLLGSLNVDELVTLEKGLSIGEPADDTGLNVTFSNDNPDIDFPFFFRVKEPGDLGDDVAKLSMDMFGQLFLEKDFGGTVLDGDDEVSDQYAFKIHALQGMFMMLEGLSGTTSTDLPKQNFITFADDTETVLGRIEASQSGPNRVVTIESGGADYAEWLPRADVDEMVQAGDIVAVVGGAISKQTYRAEHLMVVSHAPVVLGNMPQKEQENQFEKVAFMGQVPVRVRGIVQHGDYILPDGQNAGVGIAIAPADMRLTDYAQVVGMAWEASTDPAVKLINTAVGLQHNDLLEVIQKQQATIDQLSADMAAVKRLLNLDNQQNKDSETPKK